MWLPQEVIRSKRDGHELAAADIERFVAGIVDGSVSEGQIAALAMATFFQGMSLAERTALTLAMRDSGDVLSWQLDGRPVVDKHSTGGVGDLVSLVWGPIMAACGCYVPMISGRGLGHTGGTLDKLESIPGYSTTPSLSQFRQIVSQHGVAIVGQTAQLAPADRRFYAIRDVTGTVESIDLITASILAKKLAAGLDTLIMDVKVGNGAFMPQLQQATSLAQSIVDVATHAGVATQALVTDMNQPLARSAGNAIEVREALSLLGGEQRDSRLYNVIVALAVQTLLSAGQASTADAAYQQVCQVLASGAALDRFCAMVEALGGPADLHEHRDCYLALAPYQEDVYPAAAGYVARVDTRALGLAVVNLGGGRTQPEQAIDHRVGLGALAQVGEWVDGQRPLAVIYAHDATQAASVREQVRMAYQVSDSQPTTTDCVIDRIFAQELS